jgi:hypothetical protein
LTQPLQFFAKLSVLVAQTLDFNIFDLEKLKGGQENNISSMAL